MKYIFFTLLMLIPVLSFAQEDRARLRARNIVEGYVYTKENQEPLQSVAVKLLNEKDSVLYKGVVTNEKGYYRLSVGTGKYIQEVSFLGYEKVYQDLNISAKGSSIKQDTIFLEDISLELGTVVVEAQIPPMQVKGDTIEFNAGSYNVDGSSVLKDLIKQIPGLEMDANGALKANGKAINRILVDGKEYFGNDINMALSTLPATMINKLQLFEKQSEEAKASGIKDDEPEQVLNLDVKEEFKKSTFGDVKSGIGNKGRYTSSGNLNKMHGDNQYSLIGEISNINDSGYGSSSSTSFDNSIDKSLGANFNIQESEKISFNGSAVYSNYKTMDESASDAYSSILKQYSERTSKGVNRNQSMNLDATMDWKPDSLTTIYLRTSVNWGNGDNHSASMDSAHIVDKSTTTTSTRSGSENNRLGTNNSLMLSRRLNSKGRNISINLSQNYGKDNSEGTNYSEKRYWEKDELDIIDHRSKTKGISSSFGASVRYVEPLGKANRLHFSYQINVSNSDRVGDVRRLDPATGEYDIVDKDYSRTTELYSLRQNIRMGFQHTKEKYNFNLNFSVDPSYTRNKTFFVDKELEDLPQKVVNYSPSVRFGWKPGKNTFVDFSYNGSTRYPSITQLSADTIIRSAMSKSVGNPDLKPSFNNSFRVNFRKSDFESGRYFSASASYSYTFNSVVGYQEVDENSNVVNTYRNVDGNTNAYAYISFNTPLKNKKINVGTTFNVFYNRGISFINQQKKVQDRYTLSPSFYVRFNSDKFETNLNAYVNHSIGKNNLSEVERSDNTNYRISNYLKIKLPLDFALESNIDFSYRTGLGENVKKDETMWNLAVSKQFLKEKRGRLKFEFFDVLNDLRQQENTVSGSDYSNYTRKVINNYFIFSFSYRFNLLQ